MKITLRDSKPETPQPGDAWYEDPSSYEVGFAWQHKGKRPLRVQLTHADSFMIYSLAYSQEKGWYGHGWTVTGSVEAGNLTLSPSINVGAGRWHGFITNGELVSA